jgi:hypothetical protein
MGDGLLQSQFGANPHLKRANNRVNVVKGGEADGVSLIRIHQDMQSMPANERTPTATSW